VNGPQFPDLGKVVMSCFRQREPVAATPRTPTSKEKRNNATMEGLYRPLSAANVGLGNTGTLFPAVLALSLNNIVGVLRAVVRRVHSNFPRFSLRLRSQPTRAVEIHLGPSVSLLFVLCVR